MPKNFRSRWAQRKANGDRDEVYYDWKDCCASLHRTCFGAGFWYKGRLNTYAGMTLQVCDDGSADFATRWISFCCDCGDRFETVMTQLSPDYPLQPAGGQPICILPQRCQRCRGRGVTSDGFLSTARRKLAAAGQPVELLHRPGAHYVYLEPPDGSHDAGRVATLQDRWHHTQVQALWSLAHDRLVIQSVFEMPYPYPPSVGRLSNNFSG